MTSLFEKWSLMASVTFVSRLWPLPTLTYRLIYGECHMWGRMCLPFRNTWHHPLVVYQGSICLSLTNSTLLHVPVHCSLLSVLFYCFVLFYMYCELRLCNKLAHLTYDFWITDWYVCYYSANHHIWNISKIRKYLDHATTERLVHAFITSKLDFSNGLLYGVPKTSIKKLQIVQNTAARIITKTKKFDHISDVLCKLHWLPVQQRIVYKLLLLTFRALNQLAPSYISDLLTPYQPTRNLRSGSQLLLNVKPANMKSFGHRAFIHSAPNLWNELPINIRKCKSIDSFKRELKTHLFKKAYA